jgi:hypothetical protein
LFSIFEKYIGEFWENFLKASSLKLSMTKTN